MKNDINLYWVEGNCEVAFIKSSPLIGKAEILDLSELSIKKLKSRTINLPRNKKNLIINIVFDTDVLKSFPAKLTCFIENIEYLEKCGYNLKLLQQENDFEDELMRSNGINILHFNTMFNVRNKTEFKTKMLKEHSMYDKIYSKITNLRHWESSIYFKLSKHINKQSNYEKQSKTNV